MGLALGISDEISRRAKVPEGKTFLIKSVGRSSNQPAPEYIMKNFYVQGEAVLAGEIKVPFNN